MNKKYLYTLVVVAVAVFLTVAGVYFSHHTVAVLDPKGPIALKERNLLLLATGMMLIVVIPVFVITFFIVYKYREGHKGKYKPDFDHSIILEGTWWLIPTVLITALAIITWNASHQLDPYKTIASNNSNLNIEVVAMDWKWLFIYPNQHVASVNSLVIPINHPITFYITADAPMNSFWIPQLSGQIYAMAGMSTRINMLASSTGTYYGSSANISGTGFSSMHFETYAVNTNGFKTWVNLAKQSPSQMTMDQYNMLAQPSIDNPVSLYSNPDPNLYSNIINKYMAPGAQADAMMGMN